MMTAQLVDVSRQQRLILMASMIDVDVDLDLVRAMGRFYGLFLKHSFLGVNEIVQELGNDPDWSRDVVLNRITRLTDLGYLEKEHYRAWRLNIDKIMELNRSKR